MTPSVALPIVAGTARMLPAPRRAIAHALVASH